MEDIKNILLFILGTVTPTGVVICLILFFPEKLETWSSIFWKFLSIFGRLFKSAHKKYVVHDLQGRVNSFIKDLKKHTSAFGDEKLKIEFVGNEISKGAFIEENKIVLRLKRNDPDDHNFVHGAYLFISKSLLTKCKRYLSSTQKESIDLFTCSKLIKEQKPSVTGYFLEEYLHPKTEKTKSQLSLYLDDFKQIDDSNMYFPILLQELRYLGEKVFGRRRDELIITEVKSMIETLKKIANRDVGDDETDLEYYGKYCRFSIMIVGKIHKISEGVRTYENFIRKNLVPKKVETIYLLSKYENKHKLKELCSRFSISFNIDDERQLTQKIRRNGGSYDVESYLVVMRMTGIDLIQSST